MAVEITWPRAQSSTSHGNTIVASGWADESILGVVGACRSILDTTVSVSCTPVSYCMGTRGAKDELRYRWAIVVKTPGPGKYIFTVKGLRSDGKFDPEPASVEFTVALGLATIVYPASYEDITLEAGNLFAYGDLFNYPLGLLELKDSSGTVITPTSQESDYQVLECWNASYPPLTSGLYSLRVQDINGNGDLSVDIYVA